jgi:hypothetical protein
VPSARLEGTLAVPFVALAMPAAVENVWSGSPPAVHVALPQTSNVNVPVSFGSGSVNVAVRAGVAELTRRPSAGSKSAGVGGAMSAVPFAIDALPSEPVAAAFPAGCAESRTTAPLPGFVYVSESESR